MLADQIEEVEEVEAEVMVETEEGGVELGGAGVVVVVVLVHLVHHQLQQENLLVQEEAVAGRMSHDC